jgi:hypothetical protein
LIGDPARWKRKCLEADGFEGWCRFADLRQHLAGIPTAAGGYCSFGEGGAGRHRGGRYIWQIDGAWDCLVASRILDPTASPRVVEESMIDGFVKAFGALPFANIIR